MHQFAVASYYDCAMIILIWLKPRRRWMLPLREIFKTYFQLSPPIALPTLTVSIFNSFCTLRLDLTYPNMSIDTNNAFSTPKKEKPGQNQLQIDDTRSAGGSGSLTRESSLHSAFSLLPHGIYQIRISEMRLLWGMNEEAPIAVQVLFPAPYEVCD
jgi:hypothetical protein